MFDPSQFADMQIEGANSTKVIPVPEGEYPAIIDDFTFQDWRKEERSGVMLIVTWDIDDQGVKEIIGRPKALVRQSIGLDFTESGGLDMSEGRNVGLGRLREAVGQNKGGVWSFNNLRGAQAKVKVTHRADERPTAQPGDVFAEVKAVTRIA